MAHKPIEINLKMFIRDKIAMNTNVGNFLKSFFRQIEVEIKLLIISKGQRTIVHRINNKYFMDFFEHAIETIQMKRFINSTVM